MHIRPNLVNKLMLALPLIICPSRLVWLCQPEQIEQTLLLLFSLNSWKKASQRLFYLDRQGLQAVQNLILEQAIHMGTVQMIGYYQAATQFPEALLLDTAARNAARGVLIIIRDLCDPDIWPPFPPAGTAIYQRFIRPLYRNISGQDCPRVAEALGLLSHDILYTWIEERLRHLIIQAVETRQPIDPARLAELCIAPLDLLHIGDSRLPFLDSYEAWDELDATDLRPLDPEGFNAIVCRYSGLGTDYTFHLPFPRVRNFVTEERLVELRGQPLIRQEQAMRDYHLLEENSGLVRPVREILQDLGVDIASVCPHMLREKESNSIAPALHDILWPTQNCDREEDLWPQF
jgi:hypothetical protein